MLLLVSITWPSTIKLPTSLVGFPLHTRQRTVLEKIKGKKAIENNLARVSYEEGDGPAGSGYESEREKVQ